jgi:acyl carrier protein
MAARLDARDRERMRANGLRPMVADKALATLMQLMATDVSQAVVAAFEPAAGLAPTALLARHPLLAALRPAQPAQGTVPAGGLRERIAAAPEHMRLRLLTDAILALLARVMRITDASSLSADQGFFDLGLDSLTALDIRSGLEHALAQPLAPTLAFSHPNAHRLALHLLHDVLGHPRPHAPGATGDGALIQATAQARPTAAPPSVHAPVDQLSEAELADALRAEMALLAVPEVQN